MLDGGKGEAGGGRPFPQRSSGSDESCSGRWEPGWAAGVLSLWRPTRGPRNALQTVWQAGLCAGLTFINLPATEPL